MKKAFYLGAIFGGVLGVVVAVGMDIFLGQGIGSGWAEAVANDINLLFKTNLPNHHFVVILGVLFAVGIIGLFGAFLGGLSTLIIASFLKMLTKIKTTEK